MTGPEIDLDMLADAMHDQNEVSYFSPKTFKVYPEFLLDDASGSLEQFGEDADAHDHLLLVDTVPGSTSHIDMERFALLVPDEDVRDRMESAMSGRGGFRRFRDLVDEGPPELAPLWRRFETCRRHRRAAEWLRDVDAIDDTTADALVAQCDAEYDAVDAELAARQNADLATVIALERELSTPAVRSDRVRLAELVHEDFVEINAGGVIRDRAKTITAILNDDVRSEPRIMHEEVATRLADDLIEIRWRSERAGQSSMRTSLWRRGPNGWQNLRHQGTPIK
ncbi:nuclear transport factor 2 family protein [Gordonia hydrophobica]|uniref:Nuclear transport factor 2 family protein n=1 Tax=Gordonia hydrophobica TaxID=40516 RepID=A0ABZ2TXC3_9ACTN|nr:nuclear transport factor 2 family protein [Gordonia hydrophobica]MBM7366237.1 hypothetical protein [Gordonia hydrophobica]